MNTAAVKRFFPDDAEAMEICDECRHLCPVVSYHPAATLAKALGVTDGRSDLHTAILRGNADRLLGVA